MFTFKILAILYSICIGGSTLFVAYRFTYIKRIVEPMCQLCLADIIIFKNILNTVILS